jgi:hypothetical protein
MRRDRGRQRRPRHRSAGGKRVNHQHCDDEGKGCGGEAHERRGNEADQTIGWATDGIVRGLKQGLLKHGKPPIGSAWLLGGQSACDLGHRFRKFFVLCGVGELKGESGADCLICHDQRLKTRRYL